MKSSKEIQLEKLINKIKEISSQIYEDCKDNWKNSQFQIENMMVYCNIEDSMIIKDLCYKYMMEGKDPRKGIDEFELICQCSLGRS